MTNRGQELLTANQLVEAKVLFENALQKLNACTYGEGFRITLDNLTYCLLRLGQISQAVDQFRNGLMLLYGHSDRPAAIWFAKRFCQMVSKLNISFSEEQVKQLEWLVPLADPKFQALLQFLLRRSKRNAI